MWVMQKLVLVADVVSARSAIAVVVFNVCVTFGAAFYSVFAELFFVAYLPEPIVPIGVNGIVTQLCYFTVSFIAASGVQLWFALRRAVGARELFFWSRKLRLQASMLHQEADPFHPSNLRRWLGDSVAAADHASVEQHQSQQHQPPEGEGAGAGAGTRTDAAQFWAIPASHLELVHRIAAGAGGVVWSARLLVTAGQPVAVAAKQLRSSLFATEASDEDLAELAHETALLGQLSHNNIVKFLGLCLHAVPEQQGVPGIFIVQEFCAGNLRGAMELSLIHI